MAKDLDVWVSDHGRLTVLDSNARVTYETNIVADPTIDQYVHTNDNHYKRHVKRSFWNDVLDRFSFSNLVWVLFMILVGTYGFFTFSMIIDFIVLYTHFTYTTAQLLASVAIGLYILYVIIAVKLKWVIQVKIAIYLIVSMGLSFFGVTAQIASVGPFEGLYLLNSFLITLSMQILGLAAAHYFAYELCKPELMKQIQYESDPVIQSWDNFA